MAFNVTSKVMFDVSDLPRAIQNIRTAINSVRGTVNVTISPKTANNVQNLTKQFQSFNSALQRTIITASSASAALRQLGSAVSTLKDLGTVNRNVVKQQANIAAGLQTTAKAAKHTGNMMYQLGESGALALKRFAGFTIATSAVFGFIYSIGTAIKAAISFEAQLIRLGQVMPKTEGSVTRVSNLIRNLAISLGIASDQLSDIAVTFAQAGFRGLDLERALTAVAKSDLAPTFTDMKNTGEGLIAIFNQFEIKSRDFERALGAVNAVSAAFAIESDDIISAVRKVGGVFSSSSKGVSEGIDAFNEFIAVMTSIRATTRESADSIATGLRTILTRIQRPRTIQFLKDYNVELVDAQGNFVGAYEAIERLGRGLEGLDQRSTRFMRVAEELGGFRQIGKTIPLLTQQEKRQKALNVAKEGGLSLDKDVAIGIQGLGRQIAMVREQFLKLINDVFETQTFKLFAGTILTTARAFLVLADAIKPIIPLIGVLVAQRTISGLISFGQGIGGWYKSHIASMSQKGPGVYGRVSSIPGAVGGASSYLFGSGGFRGNVQTGTPNQKVMFNSLRNQIFQESGITRNKPNLIGVASVLRPVMADAAKQFKVGSEQYNAAIRAATASIVKQIRAGEQFSAIRNRYGQEMRWKAGEAGWKAGYQHGTFGASLGRVGTRMADFMFARNLTEQQMHTRAQIGTGAQMMGMIGGGAVSYMSGRNMFGNVLGGAMGGAGIGAMIGQQLIPVPGVGAWIGAAVGGIGGGIMGYQSGKAKQEAYQMELFTKALQSAITNLNEFGKATTASRVEIAKKISRDILEISGLNELTKREEIKKGMGVARTDFEAIAVEAPDSVEAIKERIRQGKIASDVRAAKESEDKAREKLLQMGDVRSAIEQEIFKRFDRGATIETIRGGGLFGDPREMFATGPDFDKNVKNMAELARRTKEIDDETDENVKAKLKEFLEIFKSNVIEENTYAWKELHKEARRLKSMFEEMMGPFEDFGISLKGLGAAFDTAIEKNRQLESVASQLFDRALAGPESSGRIINVPQNNIFRNYVDATTEQLANGMQRLGISVDSTVGQVIVGAKKLENELPKMLSDLSFRGVESVDMPSKLAEEFGPSGTFGSLPKFLRESIRVGLEKELAGKSDSEYGILERKIIEGGELKDIVEKYAQIIPETYEKVAKIVDETNRSLEAQVNLANKRIELQRALLARENQIIQTRRDYAGRRRDIFGGGQTIGDVLRERGSDIGRMARTFTSGAPSVADIRSQLMSDVFERQRIESQGGDIAAQEVLGRAIEQNVAALNRAADVTQELAQINQDMVNLERKRQTGKGIISGILNASPIERTQMMKDMLTLAETRMNPNTPRTQEQLLAMERASRQLEDWAGSLGRNEQTNARQLSDLSSLTTARAFGIENVSGAIGDLIGQATGKIEPAIQTLEGEFNRLTRESMEAADGLQHYSEILGRAASNFSENVPSLMIKNMEDAGRRFTDILGQISVSLGRFDNAINLRSFSVLGLKPMNSGGIVGGSGNKDTIPAMLTPGEFVVKKDVAEKNKGLLLALNDEKIKGYNDGGFVGYGKNRKYRDELVRLMEQEGQDASSRIIENLYRTAKSKMTSDIGQMGGHQDEVSRQLLKEMFPQGFAPYEITKEQSQYIPSTGRVKINEANKQSIPVNAFAHEQTHALQHGPGSISNLDYSRDSYRAGAEVGPVLAGTLADYESRLRGGAKPLNKEYELGGGYSPNIDWLRAQAEKHGVFKGESIDRLLSQNPQFVKMLAREKPAEGMDLPPIGESMVMIDDMILSRDRTTREIEEHKARLVEARRTDSPYTPGYEIRERAAQQIREGTLTGRIGELAGGANLDDRTIETLRANAAHAEAQSRRTGPDPSKVESAYERAMNIPNRAVYERTRGTSQAAIRPRTRTEQIVAGIGQVRPSQPMQPLEIESRTRTTQPFSSALKPPATSHPRVLPTPEVKTIQPRPTVATNQPRTLPTPEIKATPPASIFSKTPKTPEIPKTSSARQEIISQPKSVFEYRQPLQRTEIEPKPYEGDLDIFPTASEMLAKMEKSKPLPTFRDLTKDELPLPTFERAKSTDLSTFHRFEPKKLPTVEELNKEPRQYVSDKTLNEIREHQSKKNELRRSWTFPIMSDEEQASRLANKRRAMQKGTFTQTVEGLFQGANLDKSTENMLRTNAAHAEAQAQRQKFGQPDPEKVAELHQRVMDIPNKAVYDRTRGTSQAARRGLTPAERTVANIGRRAPAPLIGPLSSPKTSQPERKQPEFLDFAKWQQKRTDTSAFDEWNKRKQEEQKAGVVSPERQKFLDWKKKDDALKEQQKQQKKTEQEPLPTFYDKPQLYNPRTGMMGFESPSGGYNIRDMEGGTFGIRHQRELDSEGFVRYDPSQHLEVVNRKPSSGEEVTNLRRQQEYLEQRRQQREQSAGAISPERQAFLDWNKQREAKLEAARAQNQETMLNQAFRTESEPTSRIRQRSMQQYRSKKQQEFEEKKRKHLLTPESIRNGGEVRHQTLPSLQASSQVSQTEKPKSQLEERREQLRQNYNQEMERRRQNYQQEIERKRQNYKQSQSSDIFTATVMNPNTTFDGRRDGSSYSVAPGNVGKPSSAAKNPLMDETSQKTFEKSFMEFGKHTDALNKAIVDLGTKFDKLNINVPEIVKHEITSNINVTLGNSDTLTRQIAQEIAITVQKQMTQLISNHITMSGEIIA